MNGYIRTDQPAEIIQEEMRRQKFNLYRDKTPDTPVSNLAILGYALPSIGIFLMLFLFVRMPAYTCDAVEMAKHYDRKSEQFDELVTYAYSASFQQKPAKLKRLLRKTGCRSIDTSDPEYCELEYKRVGFDSYGYRIYRMPMSDEAIKEYSEKSEFIPHNSRMVMTYGGGVPSELGFPYSQREKYYKKYPGFD